MHPYTILYAMHCRGKVAMGELVGERFPFSNRK